MNGFKDKRDLKALNVRLDRNSGLPTRGNPHGNGASIVLVGVTPYQGAWESQVQGKGRQALQRTRIYTEEGKPIHRPELMKEMVFTIISTYQAEYRGLVEYYRLAHDLSQKLPRLKWNMERSLIKTLAAKLRIPGKRVYKRYQATLLVEGNPYKGLRVTKEREGKKPLIAVWGGIPLVWNIGAALNDQPERIWSTRSELEERLLADTCEYCGAHEQCQVHHVRALKDLQMKGRRPKPRWMVLMAARQRKTMVMCKICHEDITYGRPMRRRETSIGFMHGSGRSM